MTVLRTLVDRHFKGKNVFEIMGDDTPYQYAKENNETVQLDDVDEAVDISIQEKELEQMDVILKIIAVMIVVIGAISGAGICLLWQKRKKK